jgi:hypothetical protein
MCNSPLILLASDFTYLLALFGMFVLFSVPSLPRRLTEGLAETAGTLQKKGLDDVMMVLFGGCISKCIGNVNIEKELN